MFYILIGQCYVRLLGSGAWSLTKYRDNATTFPSHKKGMEYFSALINKGHNDVKIVSETKCP